MASKLIGELRRIGRPQVIDPPRVTIRAIIVLGDGSPDDIVMALASLHADGAKTAGIVKPIKTGIASLEALFSDASLKNLQFDVVLLAMDQEGTALNVLWNDVEGKLRGMGMTLTLPNTQSQRLHVYDCSRGPRKFRLVVVIHGVDEISVDRHTVEDHLVKAASSLGLTKVPNGNTSSKETWLGMGKDDRLKVLEELSNRKEFFSTYLRDQVKACELVEQILQ